MEKQGPIRRLHDAVISCIDINIGLLGDIPMNIILYVFRIRLTM
jgi:hypothetical protein